MLSSGCSVVHKKSEKILTSWRRTLPPQTPGLIFEVILKKQTKKPFRVYEIRDRVQMVSQHRKGFILERLCMQIVFFAMILSEAKITPVK